MTLLEWMTKWEPVWLFILLIAGLVPEIMGVMILAKRLTQRKVYRKARKDEEFEHLTTGEGK